MKERVKSIYEKKHKGDYNISDVERTTRLFFEAYGQGDKERAEFELRLQEIQSHVTRSLRKTDQKIEQTGKKLDLILTYLKAKDGNKLE